MCQTLLFLIKKIENLTDGRQVWLERFESYIISPLMTTVTLTDTSVTAIGYIIAAYILLRPELNNTPIISSIVASSVHVSIVQTFLFKLILDQPLIHTVRMNQAIVIQVCNLFFCEI